MSHDTTTHRRSRRSFVTATLAIGAAIAVLGAGSSAAPGWRTDPDWYDGAAEWALYDAVRPIYGTDRQYEATIFTNKQHADTGTTTKAEDWQSDRAVEVFKHNLSEMIETENYTYRFLTTTFVRTSDLAPYKVVASTQEDCGATYKQFVVGADEVEANEFCYFPGGGSRSSTFTPSDGLAFHDALSLTLRDYPFEADEKPVLELSLVPDQTDTHETPQKPAKATVEHVGRETIDVPYGEIEAHHLRVTHARHGGTTTSDYWFAADPDMRHVMVKYEGPFGVRYELKALDWWAYWDRSRPRPQ